MDSRRGLDVWGPAGRWVFLNWPRGSWQYDLICGAIIVGLFVLPNPQQQNADLDAVLTGIESAGGSIESFTADMSLIDRIVLFDDEETESGTLAFLKPSFVRRDFNAPNIRTEVVADGSVTIYIPRIKQAQIFPLSEAVSEELDLNVPGLQSSSDILESYDPSLVETTTDPADGVILYVVRLATKPETLLARHYKTITLSVAEGEWYPARRIVLENYTGDTTTIVLTNVDRDADLDEDDFRLELPRGTEIVRHGVSDNP